MNDWTPPKRFDDYELLHELGRGAMGQVWLAMDLQLRREVAIKFILRSTEFGTVAQQRFLQEARAIAKIHAHPNVVTVHRVGEVDDHLYQVSEYVRGTTLDSLPDLPLSQAQAFDIALDIASGLAAAHRARIVHRDVKPANAIRTDDGRVKLLDFGIAKVVVGQLPAQGTPTPVPGGAPRLSGQAQDGSIDPYATTGDEGGRVAEQFKTTGALDPFAATHAPARIDPMAATRVPTSGEARAPDLFSTGGEASQGTHSAVIKSGSAHLRAIHDVDRQKELGLGQATPMEKSLTQVGEVMGTPLYMAPEAWNGQEVDFTADVYSFGALMYELCAGKPPYEAKGIAGLWKAVTEGDHVPLSQAAVQIEPRFAAIIERCLSRNPAKRYANGDWLRAELDGLSKRAGGPVPEGNPYRGLEVFEAEHRGVYFGRDGERRQLLDRLTVDTLVVVAGDSGTGKSSLCRAGVIPHLEHRLGEDRDWRVAHLVPGSHPLNALCASLGGALGKDESELVLAMEQDPRDFARMLRTELGATRGLVLFIDQFEELTTIAEPDEAVAVGEVLAWLSTRAPSVRVLITVRGDFLGRVAELPMIGEAIAQSLYFLRPLSVERIREVVRGPALAKGYHFESDAMIDELVDSTVRAGSGGLPLLQFALAELWRKRDTRRNIIPAQALAEIGGVAGALSRYADEVIRQLSAEQVERAKRILTRLVTAEGTRARCSSDELTAGEPENLDVLERLLKSRLIASDDQVIEIAHEALVKAWGTLYEWLNADAGLRLAMQRLRTAVGEWLQADRSRAWLWRADQLRLADLIGGEPLTAEEQAFLAASRQQQRRSRLWRAAGALVVVLAAAAAFGWASVLEQRNIAAHVAEHLDRGGEAARIARAGLKAGYAKRSQALSLFDGGQGVQAEPVWAEWEAAAAAGREKLLEAERELRAGLNWDRDRGDVRTALIEVLEAHLELAIKLGGQSEQRDLVEQLRIYDPSRADQLYLPARLKLEVAHASEIYLRAVDPETREIQPLSLSPETLDTLKPGTYIVDASAEGYARTKLAVRLAPDSSTTVRFSLPKAQAVPEGFIYIPPGKALIGSWLPGGLRRGFARALPMHEVAVDGYLIGRHEVTLGDWIRFVDSLEPARRAVAMKSIGGDAKKGFGGQSVQLRKEEAGWRYKYNEALSGADEVVRYPGVDGRQFPMRAMPLTNVRLAEFQLYLAWLDRNGVPGARLCTDREWERAARGADDRLYPHGDHLDETQANIDNTRMDEQQRGPDAVGQYPASVSPYGLFDMTGNVFEWVRRTDGKGTDDRGNEVRSGAFDFSANTARIDTSEHIPDRFLGPNLGFRVCASFTP